MTTRHPLDPLSAEEIEQAVAVLRAEQRLGERTRLILLTLQEPARASVLGLPGAPPPGREAFAVVLEQRQRRHPRGGDLPGGQAPALLGARSRRAAADRARRVLRVRSGGQGPPGVAGRHAQAGDHEVRAVHGRLVVGRQRRLSRRGRAAARARADLGAGASHRQRPRATGAGRGDPRRPQHHDRRQRGRSRGGCPCPRRTAPLPRRGDDRQRGRGGAVAQRHLHPRGGLRRPVEAPRRPAPDRRGAPLAAARGVLHRHRRQLRVRLLLVLLPGREPRAAGEAHRDHLQRRRRPRGGAAVGHGGGARRLRADPPALLLRADGDDGRRAGELGGRGQHGGRSAGAGQSPRQRLPHRGYAPGA